MAKKRVIKKESTQQNVAQQKSLPPYKSYKVTSIMLVIICVVVIAAGIIREFEPWRNLTPQQIVTVKSVVSNDLASRGETIDAYNFSATMRYKHIVRVILTKDALIHEYLISMNATSNTGQIITHTQTDIYDPAYYKKYYANRNNRFI